VRLPKEFRFDTSLVTIERRGDEVVLRAKRPTVGELLRGSAKLSAKDLAAWDAVDALMQDAAPHERNWDALLGADGEAP
jgi:virulence-associated protein VagC